MQYSHEHREIQNTLKRFIDEQINPHGNEWEDNTGDGPQHKKKSLVVMMIGGGAEEIMKDLAARQHELRMP